MKHKPLSRLLSSALFLIGSFIFVAPSNAGLLGDVVTASGTSLDPSSATVGAGVEFTGIVNFLNFDFGDNTLTVSSNSNVGWGGFGNYVFSGFTDTITSFDILSNSNFTGNLLTNFSFTDHSITIDLNIGSTTAPAQLVYGFNTTSSVPEPASLALLGLGLAGLGFRRRRKS